MKHLIQAAVLSVATVVAPVAVQAATISTLADENSTIFSWGLPDTAAYGQTFTLAGASTLNDLTFRINDGGTAVSFIAYVFAWAGSQTSGAALSSVSGATAGLNGMSSVSVALGNVALGVDQYVAFLQATSAGSAAWGSVAADPYAGGAFVFQNNGGDESQFGQSSWTSGWQGAGADLAFSITLDENMSPVPLPAGGLLLIGAIGGLAALRRRKTAA